MEIKFPFSLIITFITLLFLSFNLIKNLTKKSKKTSSVAGKLPPGPWKLPFIGSIHHLAGSAPPNHVLRDLARKHGGIMHLQLGEISAVVISTPRAAKQVLKTHDVAFASRPEILASKIITKHLDIAFAPYGEYWRQMRKICTLELLSAKMVSSFSPIREDEVSKLVHYMKSSSPGSPVNVTEKIFEYTSGVVCRAAFGAKFKDEVGVIALISEGIGLAGGFDMADLFPSWRFLHVLSGMEPRLRKLQRRIDELFDEIIEQHREKYKGGQGYCDEDIVDVLLRLQENGGFDFPITDDNIKAVIQDIFAAGTETSASTTEWAMSEMLRNPGVMEKAQAELRQVLKGKHKIQETDVKELNYLKMVIKETLRLHPPIPLLLPRECSEEREIEGYTIPPKTKVIVNAWAINRDPQHWEDAESFKPERFREEGIMESMVGQNMEFIPFGGGRRVCPGIAFGLANVELPLANLLYHFSWKLPGGTKAADVDMTEVFGASSKRKNNLFLIATPAL